MSRMLKLLAVLAFFGIGGCAPAITRQYVAFPDESKEVENMGKARIYVVRSDSLGGLYSMSVRNDGILIGKTGPKGYLSWEREPGKTTITGQAENTSALELDVQKGMAYYVWQEVKMGMIKARNKLQEVTKERGKELLKMCNPPQDER
ncbi:MAG: DUF2846 domain-containing protein [Elusimicrobiota bacterium]